MTTSENFKNSSPRKRDFYHSETVSVSFLRVGTSFWAFKSFKNDCVGFNISHKILKLAVLI